MAAIIRAAAIGDEKLLAKLSTFAQDVHLERRPEHFKPTKIPELAAWYRSLLESPTARVWIAEDTGLPVGYVLAILHHLPETPFTQDRQWCEIDQIAVDPSYRRQGVARSLILKVLATARAEGILQIEAASWSFNEEAHQAFRRLGFAPKTVRFELKAEPETT